MTPRTRAGRPLTDAELRGRKHTPTEAQRASLATGVRLEVTRPGAFDGNVVQLVEKGKPLTPEGAALMRWYNAHPPADGKPQVLGGAAAQREQRARRGR